MLLAGLASPTPTSFQALLAARLTPAGAEDLSYGTAGRVAVSGGLSAAYDLQGRLLILREEDQMIEFFDTGAAAVRRRRPDGPHLRRRRPGTGRGVRHARQSGHRLLAHPLADSSALVGFYFLQGSVRSAFFDARRIGSTGTRTPPSAATGR